MQKRLGETLTALASSRTAMSFTQPRFWKRRPAERAGDELAVALYEEPQVRVELVVCRHPLQPVVVGAGHVRLVPRGVRLVEQRVHADSVVVRVRAHRHVRGPDGLGKVAVESPPHAKEVAVVREARALDERAERLVARRDDARR